MSDKFDFTIESLGPCTVKSPIELSTVVGDCTANYVKDSSYVRNAVNVYDTSKDDAMDSTNLLQKAGPREMIYFDPKKVKAAICTCGGLCPGLNDVIRAVVRCLWNRYGVRDILGFRFGYKGFFPDAGFEPIPLNPKNVDEIHKIGGSFLGTSRGGGNRITEVVDYIEKNGINMMFIIGGD
jgi:6-phosphofructokinase 1